MMRVLVCVPFTRYLPECVASWQVAFDRRDVELLYGGSMDWDRPARRANEAQKFAQARAAALADGSDALLLVQDDVVVPPGTLDRLIAAMRGGADVVYALAVRRDAGHHLSAAVELDGEEHLVALDEAPGAMDGRVHLLDVDGIGMFCTLLNRAALGVMTCEMRGRHAADWYAAQEFKRAGLRQVCDTAACVGHQVEPGVTLWPDLDGALHYRTEYSGEAVLA
jgi:hypothetical protein